MAQFRGLHTTKSHRAALLFGICLTISACQHVDDKRTPPAPVWISFPTEPEWTLYGTPAALDHKRFIKDQRIPADYPFTALTQTGFGGVLLVGDINGQPAAYDLACPVENSATIRIVVDEDLNDAYCPKCGSRYAIYNNYGTATSGVALREGYGLTKYGVGPGPNGEYMVVRR